MHTPSIDQVRNACRFLSTQAPRGCMSKLNAQGYFSADQVRAFMVRDCGKIVCGRTVSQHLLALCGKCDLATGYYNLAGL